MRGRARWLVPAVIAFVGLCAGPVAAVENETFGLTPQPERIGDSDRRTFAIPLEPGAVFEDAARIYNRTDQALELAVYAADAEAALDGTISVGFRGSDPKGVGAWIQLPRSEVNLPPRGEIVLRFRVDVGASDPSPKLGAIVVENTARGLAADLAQRLHIVVRTEPPNTPTTSTRVRPLLLRSPWIIVAFLGLVAAFVLVFVGTRRGRRPKDALLRPGEIEHAEAEAPAPQVVPEASRPVLRRLGAREPDAAAPSDEELSSAVRVGTVGPGDDTDERPMLDDMIALIDDPLDEDIPPARRRSVPPRRRRANVVVSAAGRESGKRPPKLNYIPLDEL